LEKEIYVTMIALRARSLAATAVSLTARAAGKNRA
jgi:hypothetical protein